MLQRWEQLRRWQREEQQRWRWRQRQQRWRKWWRQRRRRRKRWQQWWRCRRDGGSSGDGDSNGSGDGGNNGGGGGNEDNGSNSDVRGAQTTINYGVRKKAAAATLLKFWWRALDVSTEVIANMINTLRGECTWKGQ